jgi:STE24 endopeptidase
VVDAVCLEASGKVGVVTPDVERPALARRAAGVTAVGAAVVFAVLAAFLIPWHWVPGGHLTPVAATQLFTPAQISRADHYSSSARLLSLSSYFLAMAVALVLGFTPLGARLVRAATHRLRWWGVIPVGTLLLLVVGGLVTLPLELALRHEQLRYGLTNQGLGGWSEDSVKSLLVTWVISAVVLLVVVGMARRSPRWWFAWAGGAALLLSVAGSFLYPVVVEPLFNNFTPMPAGPFRQAVFRLADREGVHIDDVLVADASRRTTTVNAYVSGFGSTRRVVVYDNLLKDLTPAEARLVIAHELGHAKHNDVVTGTALGAVGSVFGIALLALLLDSRRLRRRAGVRSAGDPAALALILALTGVGTFLASPVQNTASRAIEARADRTAIETTGQGQVFIRMQRQLSVRSLSDPTPPWLTQFWFGSHPTAAQRAGLPASMKRAGR